MQRQITISCGPAGDNVWLLRKGERGFAVNELQNSELQSPKSKIQKCQSPTPKVQHRSPEFQMQNLELKI